MRLLYQVLLIILLVTARAVGGDYFLVDEFRVPPAEGAIAADPIVDANGTLTGFVYIAPDRQTILIENLTKRAALSISAETSVIKTINTHIGDTLFIYSLCSAALADGMTYYYPKLHLLKVYNGSVSGRDVTIPLNSPGGFLMPRTISHADISFSAATSGGADDVVFSCRELFFDYLETMGPIWEAASTSVIYDGDLDSVIYKDGSSSLVRGRFTGGSLFDVCGSTADYYSWDFRDFPGDSNYGSRSSVTVATIAGNGNLLVEQKSLVSEPMRLFSGDFIEDIDNRDEVICSGYAKDLLGLHGTTPRGHIACYSFHDGVPEEEWYQQLTPTLDFYFAAGGFITELRNGIQVAHLNVAGGFFEDVNSLPVTGFTRFFTTGPQSSVLNLLTLRSDTLRLYQYDVATPVEEPGTAPTLPRTFSVYQNYPNPFNGETFIRFQLNRADIINVAVHNVRGQKVAVLADGSFNSGEHRIAWKPDPDLASGIYFVTLSGQSGSQSIRTLYVK